MRHGRFKENGFLKAIPNLLIKYNSIFINYASICLFCGMVGSTIKVGDKIEKQIIILSQASLGVSSMKIESWSCYYGIG